ncbi:MAG: hypothetical protein LBU65_03130, partial [Planctomycetaceae bacterium]|nr:hypothetical protein [Planctomycetaceae bacterium]
ARRIPPLPVAQQKRRLTTCRSNNSHDKFLSTYKPNQTSWQYRWHELYNELFVYSCIRGKIKSYRTSLVNQ